MRFENVLIRSNKDLTSFLYTIDGVNCQQVEEFNSLCLFKEKFDYLEKFGGEIKFCKILSDVFANNLSYLDSCLPIIVSESLIRYYKSLDNTVSDIADYLAKINPLDFKGVGSMNFYAYKLKQLLFAFSCGMTPEIVWNGNHNGWEEFLVTKEDGSSFSCCYFEKNKLEDYLFYNTAFDIPSTESHDLGKIYKEDGVFYLKLNIQVRFV